MRVCVGASGGTAAAFGAPVWTARVRAPFCALFLFLCGTFVVLVNNTHSAHQPVLVLSVLGEKKQAAASWPRKPRAAAAAQCAPPRHNEQPPRAQRPKGRARYERLRVSALRNCATAKTLFPPRIANMGRSRSHEPCAEGRCCCAPRHRWDHSNWEVSMSLCLAFQRVGLDECAFGRWVNAD